MTLTLAHFLTLGAILFSLAVVGIFLNRKNIIVILMAIELILLAVNLNLVAFSAFDIAVHDAYGRLLNRDTYSTYTGEYMNRDLAAFLQQEAEGRAGLLQFLAQLIALPVPVPGFYGVDRCDKLVFLEDERRQPFKILPGESFGYGLQVAGLSNLVKVHPGWG